MCELLVCLQLKNFLPFTNPTRKPTFMITINQMMNILWQTAASVVNETTRSPWTFKLKFCEMGSTTCNRNALIAQINYTNYIMKGFVCWILMFGEIWHTVLKNLIVEIFLKLHLRKFMLVKLKSLYTFLSPRKFPILQIKPLCSVLFNKNRLNLAQS